MKHYKTAPGQRMRVDGVMVDDRPAGTALRASSAVAEHVRLGRLFEVPPSAPLEEPKPAPAKRRKDGDA